MLNYCALLYIFFCYPVVLESICYRTRAKRLINISNTTRGLRIIWTGREREKKKEKMYMVGKDTFQSASPAVGKDATKSCCLSVYSVARSRHGNQTDLHAVQAERRSYIFAFEWKVEFVQAFNAGLLAGRVAGAKLKVNNFLRVLALESHHHPGLRREKIFKGHLILQ